MLPRLLTRLAVLAASLVVASVVVFAFMNVLPGDPARVALGVNASDEAVAELRTQFGLDRPLVGQYLDWAGGLLRLDLGQSYLSQAQIGPLVGDRLQVSGILVLTSMALAVLVALPLGTWAAVAHRRASGVLVSGVSQLGIALPAFLVGILLIAVFAVQLRWLPSFGWRPPSEGWEFLSRLILPAVSLALVQAAVLTRFVRSAVLDVLREDYLRTARAKGLRPGQALRRHGLRNAAVPVVTVTGLQLATLLVGAVVIERVFTIPGLGSLLLDGVGDRDLLLVQTVVMVLVAAVLVINFVVDVLYQVIDPRVRSAL